MPALVAIAARPVKTAEPISPKISGWRRLAISPMPRATRRSDSQPPKIAPKNAQSSGTEARKPVLAMLMCCCISRYAGSQVWYIHTA